MWPVGATSPAKGVQLTGWWFDSTFFRLGCPALVRQGGCNPLVFGHGRFDSYGTHCPGPLGVGAACKAAHPVRIRQGLGSRQGDRLVLQTGSGGFDSLGFHSVIVQWLELHSDTVVTTVRLRVTVLASVVQRQSLWLSTRWVWVQVPSGALCTRSPMVEAPGLDPGCWGFESLRVYQAPLV